MPNMGFPEVMVILIIVLLVLGHKVIKKFKNAGREIQALHRTEEERRDETMASLRKIFCPNCGSEIDRSKNYCISCYKTDAELKEMTRRLDIKYCVKCGYQYSTSELLQKNFDSHYCNPTQ